MIASGRAASGILTAAAVVLLAGCATHSVKRANEVEAERAVREIPSARLLNVDIAAFDAGVPEDPDRQEAERIFRHLRQAEARYLPYELRETLQGTGQWGAVRVVPSESPGSELLVTGRIRESTGALLSLEVRAVDATGRVWLDRIYDEQAAKYSYTDPDLSGGKPFADLYNRIANDLLEVRRELAIDATRDIQRVAEMRFAADIAPDAFGQYLAKADGRYRLTGLPAEDSPMWQRLESIRERDARLMDTLDGHYRVFHSDMTPPYNEWRASSYREIQNLRELRKEALTRKVLGALAVIGGIVGLAGAESNVGAAGSQVAIIGGGYLIKSGMDKSGEAEIHIEALSELGQSVNADAKPRVVDLREKTVTLTGSAEAQYQQWRALLREIYGSETGIEDVSVREPAR